MDLGAVIDRYDRRFRAMSPNLGLFGIVSTITLKCTENFTVKGRETTVPATKRSLDLFGPGLERFLRETDYARIEWWPQRGVERAVVWQARRLPRGEAYLGVFVRIENDSPMRSR